MTFTIGIDLYLVNFVPTSKPSPCISLTSFHQEGIHSSILHRGLQNEVMCKRLTTEKMKVTRLLYFYLVGTFSLLETCGVGVFPCRYATSAYAYKVSTWLCLQIRKGLAGGLHRLPKCDCRILRKAGGGSGFHFGKRFFMLWHTEFFIPLRYSFIRLWRDC